MSAKKSASLKLIHHPYIPQQTGVWDGNFKKTDLFVYTYIKEKYSKELHLLEYTSLNLFLLETKITKHKDIYKNIYEAEFKDHSINGKPIKIINDNYKELEPYIDRYRNTKKRYTFFDAGYYSGNSLGEITYHNHFFFIYDKKINTVTIFDNVEYFYDGHKKFVRKFFKWIYSDNVKIKFGIVLLGRELESIQYNKCIKGDYKHDYLYKVSGNAIWNLWFLEMILTNPELSIEQVKSKSNKLLEESKDLICKIAISYARFIDKTTSKYELRILKGKLQIKEKQQK